MLWLGMSERARPLMLKMLLWLGMSKRARALMLMMLASGSGCLKAHRCQKVEPPNPKLLGH